MYVGLWGFFLEMLLHLFLTYIHSPLCNLYFFIFALWIWVQFTECFIHFWLL